ncbi:MAG: YicC/YloC family endoribonuclease [Acutalibacteraceae bacterium]
MIKSMTGYGRAAEIVDNESLNAEITAEIRSVNHRYFEFSAKTPRAFAFLDDKLKSFVAERVTRGKVEVFVSVNLLDASASRVSVNLPLAKAYADALRAVGECAGLSADCFSAAEIAKFPDVLSVEKAEVDEQQLTEAVLGVLEKAVEKFVAMREREGERLREDIAARCETIAAFVEKVEKLSAESVVSYRSRLEQKMRELLDKVQADEQRLITETAVFADKIAVDEETVRLRSHLRQMEEMTRGEEPVGRKLDFLVQEMNRETNTIGSKSVSLEITQIVVDMKSEIEKIREQVQNIE